MQIFEHFILTRFNLKLSFKKDKKGNNLNNNKWMEHRIKLFEKFCFPSMVNQSNLNFKWLVFFDGNTPKRYRKIIEKYRKFKNFVPIFINTKKGLKLESLRKKIKKHILKIINKKIKFIITTRLDTDDSFHKDAIKIIQKNFRRQSFEFLDFPFGFSFNNNKLYLQKSISSHFTTLIEKINKQNFRTVLCEQHQNIIYNWNINKISNKPCWLEVIHDKNLFNNYKKGRTYSLKNLKNFSIKINNK